MPRDVRPEVRDKGTPVTGVLIRATCSTAADTRAYDARLSYTLYRVADRDLTNARSFFIRPVFESDHLPKTKIVRTIV